MKNELKNTPVKSTANNAAKNNSANRYVNLPVYKDAYDLLLNVCKLNVGLPREHRYTLGERLKNELMEAMLGIYRASIDKENKDEYLRCASEHIMVVKIHLRLMHDVSLLSWQRYAGFAEQTEGVAKQVMAWRKGTAKKP